MRGDLLWRGSHVEKSLLFVRETTVGEPKEWTGKTWFGYFGREIKTGRALRAHTQIIRGLSLSVSHISPISNHFDRSSIEINGWNQ